MRSDARYMRTKTSIRVLFVEDDSATRAGYTKYLGNLGYDVTPVATGEEALTLASTCAPDVIVLDLGLQRQYRLSP
jgi:two-component system cell cycle response regulator DivK